MCSAVRRPTVGQRCFVDRDRQSAVAGNAIFAACVSDSRLATTSNHCASYARLTFIATLVAIEIFVDVPAASRCTQHRNHQRMLETNADQPRHFATRRAQFYLPFDEWQNAVVDRRSFRAFV